MKISVWIIQFAVVLMILCSSSCKVEVIAPGPPGKYETGVLISNEGPFQNGTGSISFIDPENGLVENEIFQTVNGLPLGNIVQSVNSYLDKTYVVVNNANKIEVVDAGTFESVGVISGLDQPRKFFGVTPTKAYVTQWGNSGSNGALQVVNLNTMQIDKTLGIGGGPESMVMFGDLVFVTNSGGFLNNNKVYVIDTQLDDQVGLIEVGDSPNGVVVDISGKIWVLCGGKKVYNPDFTLNLTESTAGSLYKINALNSQIEAVMEFSDVAIVLDDLVINPERSMLYFSGAGTHRHDTGLTTLDETPFLDGFYSLGIDPDNGDIYGLDAKDFVSNGEVVRYSKDGALIDTYSVGIIPGSMFK